MIFSRFSKIKAHEETNTVGCCW